MATNGFTPLYPATKRQPFGNWGLEAKRADSITVDGIKASVLDRIDTVTTLSFPFVAASDMAAWKAFEEFALAGGAFVYLEIPDYPGAASGGTIPTDMFQWPAGVASVVVGTDQPWLFTGGMNSGYPFAYGVGPGTSPASISVQPGVTVSLVYLSGLVSREVGHFGYFDAIGDPSDPGPGDSQSSGWPGYWCAPSTANASCCIAAWADNLGNLVAAPFATEDSWTGTAPAGAAQLLLGVNDTSIFDDNVGSWSFAVTLSNSYTCQLLSMDWMPKFESFGNFSLSMKLRLVEAF